MAWTEQCKLAFHANAHVGLLREKPGKDGRRPVTKILRRLAKDSGIPYETLKRWYYEMENEKNPIVKNDNGATVQDNSEKPEPKKLLQGDMCLECGEYPVFLTTSGNPLSPSSMHYGLCGSCRWRKQEAEKESRKIVCPKCGHRFLP